MAHYQIVTRKSRNPRASCSAPCSMICCNTILSRYLHGCNSSEILLYLLCEKEANFASRLITALVVQKGAPSASSTGCMVLKYL